MISSRRLRVTTLAARGVVRSAEPSPRTAWPDKPHSAVTAAMKIKRAHAPVGIYM